MVSSAGEISDPVDPLVGYSFPSLFPRTFNSQSSSVDVSNPNCPTVDSLDSHLKAMALRSPEKLLKQAKSVLDDSLDLLNADKTSVMVSEDKTEAVFTANEKDAQEKRPALGLKRAKFSAKHMPRQPDAMLEPSIDIGKLDDPEQFFATFERMENAKKELQRLRGQPLKDLDQNLSSVLPRSRRPSLFGKSATYKHHSYSSTAMDDNSETLLSSHETVDNHVLCSVPQGVSSETTATKILPNERVSESTSMETRKSNELDVLLSYDYDGLDETGVVNLLQDKLGIRFKDIDKSSLPNILDVRPCKSLSSDEDLSKVKDTISRLNGMRKAIGGKPLPVGGQPVGSAVQSRTSPARSKSPLASISLLNRHISKLTPSEDPFSAFDIDSSPAKSSPETQPGKQFDLSDVRMDLHESQRSLAHGEESITVAGLPASAVNDIASNSQAKQQFDGVSQSDQTGEVRVVHEYEKILAHEGESNAVSGRDVPSLAAKNKDANNVPAEGVDEACQFHQVRRRDDVYDFVSSPTEINERNVDSRGYSDLPLRGAYVTSDNKEWEGEVAENENSVQQTLNIDGLAVEKLTVNEASGGGDASNAKDIFAEELSEETRGFTKRKLEGKKSKAPSQTSSSDGIVKKGRKDNTLPNTPVVKKIGNKRKKVEGALPGPSKKKENRRQSLYEAGTKWEAGVRRSTRIRMRPLEYWKGERFLYGRVHNSMVTVIGVKYASPSKEAQQPTVKVKSFVSDEYKDQVDLAALY